MARQERRVRPGDVANSYVRWILGELGAHLGGLSNEEWARTLEYFGNCCAYTGARLEPAQIDRDHAIPLNAQHAGLHLFGNVLPTCKTANAEKHSQHYREFVRDPERLRRIDSFMEESGYVRRVAHLADLPKFCREQYERINALCRETSSRLSELHGALQPEKLSEAASAPAPTRAPSKPITNTTRAAAPSLRTTGNVLPIVLEPQPEEAFRDAVLAQGHAWITVEYRNGRRTISEWKMPRLSRDSRILSNLRSRPDFRQGRWQEQGIVCVRVSATRPSGA